MLSTSGHKIHAMKGVGAVYIKSGIKIKNIIFGGEQQSGLRSGTENVPGIVSFKEAACISGYVNAYGSELYCNRIVGNGETQPISLNPKCVDEKADCRIQERKPSKTF